LYADPDDEGSLAAAVSHALGGAIPARVPRERVLRAFPLARRREGLIALVQELAG
jgi:hypothetical protein